MYFYQYPTTGLSELAAVCCTYRSNVCCIVTPKIFVVLPHIEAKAEENVVPDEHLHPVKDIYLMISWLNYTSMTGSCTSIHFLYLYKSSEGQNVHNCVNFSRVRMSYFCCHNDHCTSLWLAWSINISSKNQVGSIILKDPSFSNKLMTMLKDSEVYGW